MVTTRSMQPDHHKGPCFSKIIINEAYLEHLKIPPKFVSKYMSEYESDELTLKGPSNESMTVKLSKHEKKMYLKNGWSTFCTNHSVANEDFLLFRYAGNGCFRVQIFKGDGCERLGGGGDQNAASSSGKNIRK